MSRKSQQSRDVTRREFVHASAAAAAALALPGAPALVGRADTLRIGLVGCGGRGTGAGQKSPPSSGRGAVAALRGPFPERGTDRRGEPARLAGEGTSGGGAKKKKNG